MLLALVCGTAGAQTYTKINTTYTWDSVGIDTGLYSDDTASGLINIGFNFPIGGTTYSGLYLNTNGLVTFTSGTSSLSNAVPPTANAPYPALMVFWDDLHSGYGGSSITYGTLGAAPNRRFVISYNNIAQYNNSGYRYTFQVALFESGNVEYRYQSMSCCVATASVGVQVSASDFTSHGDVSTMSSGTAIAFVGTGLLGQYHNNTSLSSLVLTRVDQTVNFSWGNGSPDATVPADNFSVRWSGSLLVPTTGMYTFQTLSDDGVRMSINGQQVINNWTWHAPTYDTSLAVYLVAGTRYPIGMDMYEGTGGATAVLNWRRPGDTAFSVIPAGNGTEGLYPYSASVVPDRGILNGLVWWSRAGSLANADASSVATWLNHVDSSRPLTGSTTAPQFRNNNALNINFNPVIQFTSTTDTVAGAQYFTAPSMLGLANHTQEHLLFVGYPTANNRTTTLFSELGSGSSFYTHFSWSDGNIYFDPGAPTGSGSLRSVYSPTRFVNAPSLYAMLNNATSSANLPLAGNHGVRQDGQTKVTSNNVASTTGINSTFRVGWPAQNNAWNGVIAEGMLLLDKQLTPIELSQLESYLGVKYGVTLGGSASTTTAYLHSGASTIWAANSGYHNNIVGLGRDDTTTLNQLISRSVNSGDQITVTTGTSMPSTASVINATTGGVAFATDRSYTLISDNGQSATGTAGITVGAQAGRTRSSRIWRLQMTGTVPSQLSICIPDSMLPSGFTSGAWATDLWLSTATSADFSTGTASATMTAATCVASGVGVSTGVPGRLATISSTVLNGMGGVGFFTVTRKLLDHIEITAGSNSGVTCAPTTYTVKACGDAACSTLYTGGLTGTLTLTGTGVTANFPSGAAFTIASGNSSTTVAAQVTTPSTATVGATGLSLTPGNAKPVFCGLGVTANSTNACTMAVADAGFLLSVPHHRAGYSQTVSLSAVKKADNSLACVAAFTGTQTVNVGCSYLNPSTGTKPLLVGGAAATNTSSNPSGTCNASTSTRSLVFDNNGQTTTTVQYDDVGQVQLSVSASGSGSSAGLSLTGSANFLIAPFKTFVLSNLPGAAISAGSPFGYTVTAVNAAMAATPNFGRETPPESITMSWVRNQPTGANAVDSSFSTGTPAGVVNGAVNYSNASWSEVGRATLSARLTSGNYMGSGFSTVGSSAAAWQCASENGTCAVPAGTTASVSFDAGGASLFFKHGLTGNVPCTSAYFGDPKSGSSKTCWILIESGVYSPATGALLFKPHHFDVSTATACGSFSYAGQPFGVTVTAKNLAGSTTQNYDGTANTSPSFAKAVSFSDITASPPGSLSGSLAASAFNRGVASVAAGGANAPVYSFSNKLTAAQTISLRATDTDGVSSNGFTEGSMALRSGRLQMSNAFGSEKSSLQIPLQLQYWSGKSWVKNSEDTCTVIPTASVVLAQTRNHNNAVPNWSSTVSGLTLSGGSGFITLAAPSPSGTGTVDLAINLGVGPNTQDASCLANHPNTTGAGLPWLRSRQGNCATSFDRDPSARGTFGIYTPETQKSVHVREVF